MGTIYNWTNVVVANEKLESTGTSQKFWNRYPQRGNIESAPRCGRPPKNRQSRPSASKTMLRYVKPEESR